jgi:hypothetical protein
MGTIRRKTWGLGPLLVFVLGLFLSGCGEARERGEGVAPAERDSAVASPGDDEAEVTRLAHDFMQALSERNTSRLDELMAPHARLFSIREGDAGPVYGVRTREEFLEGLAGGESAFVERIWEPVVEVAGRVAMVFAPYDFHLNGELSHCGIDILAFMKLEEGWKVTSVTYNVVREGCPVSPLGTPGG